MCVGVSPACVGVGVCMCVCEGGKEKERITVGEKKKKKKKTCIDFLAIVQWPDLNALLKGEKFISFGKEIGCFLYKSFKLISARKLNANITMNRKL